MALFPSKLAYVSDFHLTSKNSRCRGGDIVELCEKSIEYIFSKASTIILAGDVFNSWNVGYEIPAILIEMANRYDVQIYYVRGQHDYYGRNADSRKSAEHLFSLSPRAHRLGQGYAEDGAPCIYHDSIIDIGKHRVSITGISYNDFPFFAKHLQLIMDEEKGGRESFDKLCGATVHILVVHGPITLNPAPYLNGMKTSTLFKAVSSLYNIVVLGDIHIPYIDVSSEYDSRVINAGAIIQLRSEEKDYKPHFWTHSFIDNSFEQVFIPDEIQAICPWVESTEEMTHTELKAIGEKVGTALNKIRGSLSRNVSSALDKDLKSIILKADISEDAKELIQQAIFAANEQ